MRPDFVMNDQLIREDACFGDTVSAVCPLCSSGHIRDCLKAPDRFHLRRDCYTLKRCSNCSGVWLPDAPAPSEMGMHYDEDYHRAIAKAGEESAEKRWKRHRQLISQFKTSGSILDIGCSSGAFLSVMDKSKWSLFGIELEPATGEKARLTTGANIFIGDIADAPFEPGTFDVITCFDVLEHVYDARDFLARVRRFLNPGGIFVTMLPNIEAWESRLFGSYWYGLELPRHLFHFSPRSLRLLARTLEFQELHLRTSRICYVERSLGYIWRAGLEKLGYTATPPCKPKPARFFHRGARKIFRTVVLTPFAALAASAGAGASIEAVFQKTSTGG